MEWTVTSPRSSRANSMPLAELQCFIDELLGRLRAPRPVSHASPLPRVPVTISTSCSRKRSSRKGRSWTDLSIGADFLVAMLCGPFGDIGVKTFSILHHRREQDKLPACFALPFAGGGRVHRAFALRREAGSPGNIVFPSRAKSSRTK